MNHEHEPSGGESDDEPRPEQGPEAGPRIYLASLADYNAGRLHGVWAEAQAVEELDEALRGMLAASPEPGAEEWAIHDYEGFGPLHLDEHEPLERVALLGRGIAEHGPAFAHFAALAGASAPDLEERFRDAYLGHWPSLEEYAENLLADLGYEQLLERAVPEQLQPYVRLDVERFARDLELGGDISASIGDGGVYIFEARG